MVAIKRSHATESCPFSFLAKPVINGGRGGIISFLVSRVQANKAERPPRIAIALSSIYNGGEWVVGVAGWYGEGFSGWDILLRRSVALSLSLSLSLFSLSRSLSLSLSLSLSHHYSPPLKG